MLLLQQARRKEVQALLAGVQSGLPVYSCHRLEASQAARPQHGTCAMLCSLY